eukprot:COSAG02_NODE_1206_length_13888_cov_15.018130_1_plen_571_part_00
MAARATQLELLCGFYARHDPAKSREAIEEIIDKRRGAAPALSNQRWDAISAALEKKYGEPLPKLAPEPAREPAPEPEPEPAPPGEAGATTAPRPRASFTAAARAVTASAVSAAGAAALTAADKTGVSAVADKAGISSGLSVGLSAGLSAAGKAAAGFTSRTAEPSARSGGGANSVALPGNTASPVEPEPERPSAEELEAAKAKRLARVTELTELEQQALASMVVQLEEEMVSVRAKAKRLMLEMVREKDATIQAARDAEAAAVGELSEATRRGEVRQKRIEQLQRDIEQQQAELVAWEKSAEESTATGQARVLELEGEARDLREALTAAGVESASKLRGMHREIESSRAEHAQLQVEVAELATALAASERSLESYKARAEAAEAISTTAAAQTTITAAAPPCAVLTNSAVSQPATDEALEEQQMAVLEGRVLRERCATLEARARAAETKVDEARRASTAAQASAKELQVSYTELEARHKEMVKAWVGAQPAQEAADALEKAEAQQATIDELELRVQQKEEEIIRLRSLASQGLAVRTYRTYSASVGFVLMPCSATLKTVTWHKRECHVSA